MHFFLSNKSINCIIKNLTSLQDDFNDIEKDILELIVKKEANRNINSFETVDNINRKITKFKEKQEQVDLENNKFKTIVEVFLNDSKTSFNISTLSPSNIEQNTKQFHKEPSNKTVYSNLNDNLILKISEKQKRVYLPYTKTEIENLLKNYPDDYKDAKDVIEQEFIADISIYSKHPVLARFREAYSLSRNKEMKSAIDSLKYAMDLMFRSDINPTIIAAVKSQKQLEDYIQCLENSTLDSFPHFTIVFEVNPI